MKVEFSFTLKEVFRYASLELRHVALNSRFFRGVIYFQIIMAVVVLVLPFSIEFFIQHVLHWYISTSAIKWRLVFGLIVFLFLLAFYFITVSVVIVFYKVLYRRAWLQIDPEGVTASVRRRKLIWQDVLLVDQDEQYLYLGSKGKAHGPIFFTMLPKRAFDSPESARVFFELAEGYWKGAGGEEATSTQTGWPPAPKVS